MSETTAANPMPPPKPPINDGGPAYPHPVATPFGNGSMAEGGLSVRQWYAGQVLVSLLANPNFGYSWRNAAKEAFAYADAMIAHEAQERGAGQ